MYRYGKLVLPIVDKDLNKQPQDVFIDFFNYPPSFLQCNNSEIRPGKHIGVCISVANNRLFVGSIPKSKTKEQIVEEFAKVTGESAPCFDFLIYIFTVYNARISG